MASFFRPGIWQFSHFIFNLTSYTNFLIAHSCGEMFLGLKLSIKTMWNIPKVTIFPWIRDFRPYTPPGHFWSHNADGNAKIVPITHPDSSNHITFLDHSQGPHTKKA